MAPQHPAEEDEDGNTGTGVGVEIGEEMESEVAHPPVSSELRLKSNQDRDSAREGLTRSRKRSHPMSGEEGSSKLPALGSSHGRVAPLKPKKTLVTLGGRKINPSGDAADAGKAKGDGSSPAKGFVAPPRRSLKTAHK